ncbi:MAG: hypothetical protein ACRC3I_00440 [Cetobacterium sp.]
MENLTLVWILAEFYIINKEIEFNEELLLNQMKKIESLIKISIYRKLDTK